MNAWTAAIRNWLVACLHAWDRFWFTPAQPHTLALIRILAGGMLFYTHLVWALDLDAFLGPHSWVTADVARELTRDGYAWSYLWYVDSPALLWVLHVLSIASVCDADAGALHARRRRAGVADYRRLLSSPDRRLVRAGPGECDASNVSGGRPKRGRVLAGPLAGAGQGRGAHRTLASGRISPSA